MNIKKSILLLVFYFIFGAPFSWAAVSLSVQSVDGSNTVRFRGGMESSLERKEIRVRINSTDGRKYQVFQRLMEPLINEKGETLDFQALQMASVPGSNASGTLYMESIDRVGMGDQLLYSSGQNGESDSFLVAYALDSSRINGSGSYGGRMVFSVRTLGEPSQAQVSVNLQVEAFSSWKAQVTAGRSRDTVRVKDTDTSDAQADYGKISFSGAKGQEVRIYQQMDDLPRSAAGDYMRQGVLMFSAEASRQPGSVAAGAAPLAVSNTLIYSGRIDADDVLVKFFLNPDQISAQSAGAYSGRVRFVVETDQSRQEFGLALECDIKPVFTVDVMLPSGGVVFDNVLPNTPAREQVVQVKVRSNLRRPYQVLQDLPVTMTNDKGQSLKKDYFMMKVEVPAGEKGKTRWVDFSPVEIGESTVFSSDSQGTPATFNVLYRLQGYPQMSGGSFAAQIKYSLNQN